MIRKTLISGSEDQSKTTTRATYLRRTSYVVPPIGSYLGPIWVLYGSYHRLGGPTYLGGKNMGPINFLGGPIYFLGGPIFFIGGPIFRDRRSYTDIGGPKIL